MRMPSRPGPAYPLLDHRVRSREKRGGNVEAKRLRGLHVDHHFKTFSLLSR